MPKASEPAAAISPSSLPAEKECSSLYGLLSALCAFLTWGFLPIYWKALAAVDPFELMCHRIFWSFFILLPLMFSHGRLGMVFNFLKNGRSVLTLLCSSCILAGNWFLYIWAINADKVIEASLGYFINPLINILFGIVIFKERTSMIVRLAIGLAAVGVAYQIFVLGRSPFIPLTLACSFGIYGLLRKIMPLPSLPGLFLETLLLMPFAGAYIFYQQKIGLSPLFSGDASLVLLLIGTGLVTSFPLLCFAYSARNIKMTTLGLLQYFSPTITFLLGVFLYREPFSMNDLVTFACIWAALAMYTWETLRIRRW